MGADPKKGEETNSEPSKQNKKKEKEKAKPANSLRVQVVEKTREDMLAGMKNK